MKYSEFHRKIVKKGWRFTYTEGSHYFYTKDGALSPPVPCTLPRCKRNVRTITERNFKTNENEIIIMNTIIIKVGASSDHFGAYGKNCDGIFGAGNTADEARKDALKGLELLVKTRDKKELPSILQGEYAIEYEYDTQSFLNYYNRIFTNVALERMTGINQKLLHHYSTGLKKPRVMQRKKIERALHDLGNELLAVRL